jgi:hypothetical protein
MTHGLSPCLGTHGQIAEGTEESVKARLDPCSEPDLLDAGSPPAGLEHDFWVLFAHGTSHLHPVIQAKKKKPLGPTLPGAMQHPCRAIAPPPVIPSTALESCRQGGG